MDFFSDSLARLKYALRVSKDQEVADALGMSKTAFSERKKRGSFPSEQLRVLAAKRPDLGIDVEYVLTGGTLTERQRQMQSLAQQATDAVDVGDAERQRLNDLLTQAGLSQASRNAQRAATYERITELLNDCTDGTLAMVEQMISRCRIADLSASPEQNQSH